MLSAYLPAATTPRIGGKRKVESIIMDNVRSLSMTLPGNTHLRDENERRTGKRPTTSEHNPLMAHNGTTGIGRRAERARKDSL
jgi:hypothetical protein